MVENELKICKLCGLFRFKTSKSISQVNLAGGWLRGRRRLPKTNFCKILCDWLQSLGMLIVCYHVVRKVVTHYMVNRRS